MKNLTEIYPRLGSHTSVLTLGLVLAGTGFSSVAENAGGNALSALLEEVVVTARKREESAQDVPLSVSAYGSDQLEAMKVRDLTSLSVGMPNVALDDVGTTKGTANFSIRGLGVNSSIPSIDPTVGVFVDGVYMGLNNGIIFDTFDLESVEVLRGPQGILFGRNVTGGAVLLNTKLPGQEFEASARVTLEGGGEGLNKYVMANVSGPLTETLAAKLAVYTNDDDGWFKNEATGKEHGKADTDMARATLAWDVSEDLSIVVRYEYSESENDGPAAQNHTNASGVNPTLAFGQPTFDRDSHKFAINETGYLNSRTNFFSTQVDWDVGFGNGTVTNIFGWRDYTSEALLDVDGTALSIFHSQAWTDAEQFSNELRYAGTFNDNLTLTTGLYYFTNEINYSERRLISGGTTTQDGGGDYDVESMGVFIAGDYDVTENLTLSAGARYTKEEKEADIASLNLNVNSPCNVVSGTCDFDFQDDEEWTSFSPKLGFNYHISEEVNVYGHWSRGFRSGGYNLRNTATDPDNGPGPFDEEQVDSFELGFKMSLGERGRLNGAIFYNDIQDMQREINEADGLGVVQIIRNTADAELYGIELDSTYALTDQLVLTASIGWLNAEYTDVSFDLNGDGNVDSLDEKLDIPRAAELTYSVGLTHEMPIGDWGSMSSRINYAYRDDSAYTDNNLGYIDTQRILDVGVDFYSNDDHWVIGLYGKNLKDEVKHGGDTQLSFGTFSPLSKGTTYGVEVTYNY
ncbi:TonB-dependent receptor [Maricurvus nonylphenolicus]|uniref:TonB-dependent receptor n=1 Tax=Maricurvus nonylphenolicus TaxID=1008307 RepID=UPI0036F1E033